MDGGQSICPKTFLLLLCERICLQCRLENRHQRDQQPNLIRGSRTGASGQMKRGEPTGVLLHGCAELGREVDDRGLSADYVQFAKKLRRIADAFEQ